MGDRQNLIEFQDLLKGHAQFILLGDGKRPRYRYGSSRSKHRYSQIPNNSNYGVLPIGELLVLDLDIGGDIKDQEDFFSIVFGVNLAETLTVDTPSGGRHYYLFATEAPKKGESILPRGSLRGQIARLLLKEYDGHVKIDADLRSAQQNGYVVGPTEYKSGGYLLNLNEIQRIPEKNYSRLTRTISQYYLERAQKLIRGPESSEEDKTSLDDYPEWLYTSLEVGLAKRDNQSYHSKRAVVKSLLGCCYDDIAIAGLCKKLKINRDSYRGRFLRDVELLQDLGRLDTPSHRGPLCRKSPSHSEEGKKKQEHRRLPYIDRGVGVGKRNYRVLYMGLIEKSLAKRASRSSQVYRDAYAIVEHFLQPLSNFGARKIILAHDELKRYFRISSSRISASLRLLREAGVIVIYKKPLPGRSTIYEVPQKWNDKALTKILKKTWFSHVIEDDYALHPSVEFLHRERLFVDAITRRPLFRVSGGEADFTPPVRVPKKLGSIAISYLVNEVDRRILPDGDFVESRPWSPDLTLLATIDDAFFSSSRLLELLKVDEESETFPSEREDDEEWSQLAIPLFSIEQDQLTTGEKIVVNSF